MYILYTCIIIILTHMHATSTCSHTFACSHKKNWWDYIWWDYIWWDYIWRIIFGGFGQKPSLIEGLLKQKLPSYDLAVHLVIFKSTKLDSLPMYQCTHAHTHVPMHAHTHVYIQVACSTHAHTHIHTYLRTHRRLLTFILHRRQKSNCCTWPDTVSRRGGWGLVGTLVAR